MEMTGKTATGAAPRPGWVRLPCQVCGAPIHGGCLVATAFLARHADANIQAWCDDHMTPGGARIYIDLKGKEF